MHSFTSCLVHCVWSTKNREPWLTLDLRERLWPYLGGIAKQNQMRRSPLAGPATTSMFSSLCQPHYPSLKRSSYSKEIHRNGFEKPFRRCVPSLGRRATVHLALAFQAWTPPWLTFEIRRTIIERGPFAMSL